MIAQDRLRDDDLIVDCHAVVQCGAMLVSIEVSIFSRQTFVPF